MLHIQNLQNQRFSFNLVPYLLTFIKSGKTVQSIWMSLKYIVKHSLFLPVFLTLLLASWQAQAADDISQGWVSIRVTDQSREVRENAFQRGLRTMFIRISGDRAVMEKLQGLENPLPESRLYVQQFSYVPLKAPVFDSKGELFTELIKIRYNTGRIEQYLRENELIVEGSQKDETRSIVHIEIESVDSMTKYNRVENYLTQLSEVETVSPLQTDGDIVLFELVLRSTEARFLSTIDKDGRLLKVKIKKVAEQTDNFQVSDSKAIVLSKNNAEMNRTQNNETKFNSQPEISTRQMQSLESKKRQTIPPYTVPAPVPLPDMQTPVYQYRFVR